MKTIIAGMRDFHDYAVVCDAVDAAGWKVSEVVSGCATGVDTLGERWAADKDVPVKRFPADWKKHGRSAGPKRNRQMAEYGDALVAVWDGQSRGTRNMIEIATSLGLRVYVHMTHSSITRVPPEPEN
jgi:hypothetical protein